MLPRRASAISPAVVNQGAGVFELGRTADHHAVGIHQERTGQPAVAGHGFQFGEHQPELDVAVAVAQRTVELDAVRNLHRVDQDAVELLLHILARDIDRAVQRGAHIGREPGRHADIQGDGGEHRDQDGGHHRDEGEPGDQPHMQLGAGAPRTPRRPQPGQPPADQGGQCQHQHQVDQHQDDQAGAVQGVGRQPREQHVGGDARNHSQQRHAKGELRRPGYRAQAGAPLRERRFANHVFRYDRPHPEPGHWARV